MSSDSYFQWTCDCESDWGGRTTGTQGILEGLPRILEVFRANRIKALFFISTEIALDNRGRIQDILDKGHEIGSHGHFHIRYKDSFRVEADRQISERLLSIFRTGTFLYRAPRFYHQSEDSLYSYRNNHVSLLKQAWFGGRIPTYPIFYIHPFDIVRGTNPPNLFARILYKNPERVYELFTKLTKEYPGRKRL